MFNFKPCVVSGCPNHAVSFQDVCYNHVEQKDAYRENLYSYLKNNDKFAGLNLAYVPFIDLDIREKVFLLVDFNHALLRNVVSENLTLHMCFLDYSTFDSCKLVGSKHTHCVFAGARMTDTRITDANMLQNNFNNTVLKNVSFNESDLYNSRFIAGRLEDTAFHDCNLKNVDFRRSLRQNITFKYSNSEDAIFDPEDES
ncbi:MAG: pentapeptide repeat-containing protein [Spirochaetales bacterium]|jgi:uncharacterized protein YjbI with pentapeptide repeats|nr:pentapeptide repeat-containing protein [Spirochaetales bacterium]